MRVELTKRADYAIRAVVALARTTGAERLSVRQVAADQGVPKRFLTHVMGDLVRAGLVEATIGRSGGYRLARRSAEISLLDVVEAVEGDSHRRTCVLRGGPCAIDDRCGVHAVFAGVKDDVIGRLRSATVEAAARTS